MKFHLVFYVIFLNLIIMNLKYQVVAMCGSDVRGRITRKD